MLRVGRVLMILKNLLFVLKFTSYDKYIPKYYS